MVLQPHAITKDPYQQHNNVIDHLIAPINEFIEYIFDFSIKANASP